MTYIHYIKDELQYPFRDVNPADDKIRGGVGKPKGIWFSVGTAWIDWCQDNWQSWVAKRSVEFDLSACRLKVVKTAESKAFEEEYGIPQMPGLPRYPALETPDWARLLAEGYDGIIVPDYRRTWGWDEAQGVWWYGWDCPSGCVWNASKIRILG